jgi:hypothetical protein
MGNSLVLLHDVRHIRQYHLTEVRVHYCDEAVEFGMASVSRASLKLIGHEIRVLWKDLLATEMYGKSFESKKDDRAEASTEELIPVKVSTLVKD